MNSDHLLSNSLLAGTQWDTYGPLGPQLLPVDQCPSKHVGQSDKTDVFLQMSDVTYLLRRTQCPTVLLSGLHAINMVSKQFYSTYRGQILTTKRRKQIKFRHLHSQCGVDGSNRNGDQERNRKLPPPNGPRSQLPPTLEFPSPNLEVGFPAAICPEWDSGDI